MEIILVHGAWHGAWCWERLVPYLSFFSKVHCLEMPGRRFEATPQYHKITLHDYVECIEKCLLSCQGKVILMGHSLAGLSISQVAEHYPEKIQSLVYLAAFVPDNGECLFDITKTFQTPGISTELIAHPQKNMMEIKKSAFTSDVFYNKCKMDEADKALKKLCPEPLRAFNTSVSLTPERFGKVKKIYIKCTEDKAITFYDQDKMAMKANVDKVVDLQSDHSPFISYPDELAKIFRLMTAHDSFH